MMKLLKSLFTIFCLLLVSPAFAANSSVPNMTAATSVAATDLWYCVQSSGTLDRKCTSSQVAAYVYGLMSGDGTASGTGALTLATVNANVGSFGSATSCVTLTVNAKGLITAASAATCTPAIGSVTGLGTGVATALGVNIGTAGSFVTNGGALGTPSSGTLTNATGLPIAGISGLGTGVATALAIAPGTTGSFPTQDGTITTGHCLQWGPGVQDAGAACGTGGSGITNLGVGAALVSSTTTACSQTTISAGGSTLSGAECLNAQIGTTYAIQDSDRGKLITGTNSATQAYTIAQAGASTTFQSGWYARIQNKGTGTLTITPTTSTICGAASYTVMPGWTVKITSDGTNYQCDSGSTGSLAISTQTGANYAFVTANFGQLVNLSNAANQIPTLPQAGSAGFPAGWYVQACNQGAGTQTITPTTSTIGGASTYVLPAASAAAPACVGIVSDGTNYQVLPDFTTNAAYLTSGTLPTGRMPALTGDCTTSAGAVATTCTKTNGTAFGALATVTPGSNVATAAAVALSGAGGLTSTIASGTVALGTTAIASGACATVVTATATNAATTDVVLASFNGDPTAVTGYAPATTGMLTIITYPTANTFNAKVCNNTSASITPGAITLNWRVVR